MTYKDFEELNQIRIDKVFETLRNKNKEYASGDIFSNFKEATDVAGKSPEAVAFDYDLKHIISIRDIVNGKECTPELWAEKIGDYLAYGLVMNALMVERFQREYDGKLTIKSDDGEIRLGYEQVKQLAEALVDPPAGSWQGSRIVYQNVDLRSGDGTERQ